MRYAHHYKKIFFSADIKISNAKELEIEKTELKKEIAIENLEKIKLARERLEKLDIETKKLENQEYLEYLQKLEIAREKLELKLIIEVRTKELKKLELEILKILEKTKKTRKTKTKKAERAK